MVCNSINHNFYNLAIPRNGSINAVILEIELPLTQNTGLVSKALDETFKEKTTNVTLSVTGNPQYLILEVTMYISVTAAENGEEAGVIGTVDATTTATASPTTKTTDEPTQKCMLKC